MPGHGDDEAEPPEEPPEEADGGGGEPGGLPGDDDDDDDDEAAGGGAASKTCTYGGCSETTDQVAKQRKPWMCKKHRNKMYKDKYKKKKSDQASGSAAAAAAAGTGPPAPGGNVKLEDSADGSVSIAKQRTGSLGDRPAKPTLLEQVLNQKRLSLLRSPEVVHFLQKQQQLLSQQALEQRQQQFPGASV